jgi:hypothetical protein
MISTGLPCLAWCNGAEGSPPRGRGAEATRRRPALFWPRVGGSRTETAAWPWHAVPQRSRRIRFVKTPPTRRLNSFWPGRCSSSPSLKLKMATTRGDRNQQTGGGDL